jgi:hypothetical protein
LVLTAADAEIPAAAGVTADVAGVAATAVSVV